jgi:hypothetical protein
MLIAVTRVNQEGEPDDGRAFDQRSNPSPNRVEEVAPQIAPAVGVIPEEERQCESHHVIATSDASLGNDQHLRG